MYESYSVTNLGYKCIECIHLDSIDFHLDILSLLLDQNSYLFDDNLENSILDGLSPFFLFFGILPRQTGQHSPFFSTGVVQFFNSYERFPYHLNHWVEIPSSELKIQDSPLDI